MIPLISLTLQSHHFLIEHQSERAFFAELIAKLTILFPYTRQESEYGSGYMPN